MLTMSIIFLVLRYPVRTVLALPAVSMQTMYLYTEQECSADNPRSLPIQHSTSRPFQVLFEAVFVHAVRVDARSVAVHADGANLQVFTHTLSVYTYVTPYRIVHNYRVKHLANGLSGSSTRCTRLTASFQSLYWIPHN